MRERLIVEIEKILKALAHRNRLRIINLLKRQKLCVCELENLMEANQSNVSRHLSKLKNAGIIKSKRDAQWIYYSLNEEFLQQHAFLDRIIAEELQAGIFQQDKQRLDIYLQSDLNCKDLKAGEEIIVSEESE